MKLLQVVLFAAIGAVLALLLVRIAGGALDAPLRLDWGILLTFFVLALIFEAGLTFGNPEKSPFLRRHNPKKLRIVCLTCLGSLIAVALISILVFSPSYLTKGDIFPLYQRENRSEQ